MGAVTSAYRRIDVSAADAFPALAMAFVTV